MICAPPTGRVPGVPVAVVLAFLLIVSGCASVGPTRPPGPAVPMNTVRIEADPEGHLPARFWDAYSLFQQATRAFDAGRLAEAESLFARIPVEFPESDLAPLSRFNRGLCLENQQRYPEARQTYEALLVDRAMEVDRVEVLFHIGSCLEGEGDWAGAADLFAQRVGTLGLTPIRAAEAKVRLGVATYHLGKEDEAIPILRSGLGAIRKLRRHPVRLAESYVGRGYFTLGEIYRGRYEKTQLRGSDEEMERSVNEKAELLYVARAQYVQAIRSYVADWMTAALYRIGDLYFDFYRAVLSAPLPPDLTPSETAEYKEKLSERMAPVLRKAIAAHKRNLKLADEVQSETTWVARSRERLMELEAR